jgi:hypothetical protein
MYVILRVNAFDPERLAASADKLQEFDRIHSAQPGFWARSRSTSRTGAAS